MGQKWDRLQGYTTDIGFKNMTLPRQRRRNVKCPDCNLWVYDHPPRNCTCGGVLRLQHFQMQAFHEMWLTEAFRVLKPGGSIRAMSGSRTWHRLAAAMKAVGFVEIEREEWCFFSGFPKSLNVSKAFDKKLGEEREVVGTKVRGDVEKGKANSTTYAAADANKGNTKIFGYGVEEITKPSSDLAKRWDGYGTALKPAREIIIIGRKNVFQTPYY